MSLKLTLHTQPEVPLEAETISPDRLRGLAPSEVEQLPVMHGNRNLKLGDFFKVEIQRHDEIRVCGDLANVKLVGAVMTHGKLIVEGNIGAHLGAAMSGGEILVEGNAGDWVGPEMVGGRIVVEGNAGHMVGSAYRGSAVGMQGGEILVNGDAGNEVGSAMRRGFVAIGGRCGDFAGVNMLAGTIILLGESGIRHGAGMRRGTIAAMRETAVLPSFEFACRYQPLFLRFYLLELRKMGFDIEEAQIFGHYRRYSGDAVELNRGELLILDD